MQKSRILIVDDNEPGRYAIAQCLRQAGHEVIEAGTAQGCYAAISSGKCDLILLDVRLPDGDGIEISRRLKSEPKTAGIPIVQISAYFTAAIDRVRGLESGADAYLSAPFEPRELLAQVDALLRARRAEERLRLATEAARMFTWECDPLKKTVQWSENAAQTIGCAPEELPGNIRDSMFFVHPAEAERIGSEYQDVLRSRRAHYRLEFRGRDEGEKTKYWQSDGCVVYDGSGEPVRVVGVTQDITERKHSEETLRGQSELLTAIVDNIPVLLCIWDAELKTFRFNKHLREVLGWTEADTLDGDFVSKVYPDPEYRQEVAEFMRSLEKTWRDLKTTARDGTAVDISWANVGLPNSSFVGIGVDIRARKKVEEALRESEERFRAMADGLPLIVWVHDAHGRQEWVNNTFCEFFGVTREQMVDGEWKLLMHPEDAPAYSAAFEESVRERRPFHSEVRVRNAAGEWRCIESWARPRFSRTGDFLGFVGTSADITERKQFGTALERLVNERTEKLHELVGELEHFSYSITHDMRAPLRAMRGFAEVMKEMLADSDQAELRTFIRQIITSAERMDLLITDALNYSRAVRRDLTLVPVDVGRLLDGMLETYPHFLAHRSRIHLEGPLPVVIGNEAALTQCFSNLVGNALKFTQPDKEPEVRIRAEAVPASACGATNGDSWVRLWIEDSGIGIAERMLPHIFDMFVRGSGHQVGTGIGLALVRKVVQRMGGRVGVESAAGQGSRFWVELRSADSPDPVHSSNVSESHRQIPRDGALPA
jgi:PAS domain S-box-containing protein